MKTGFFGCLLVGLSEREREREFGRLDGFAKSSIIDNCRKPVVDNFLSQS